MNPTVFDIFPGQQRSPSNFSAIRISLANPELIRKPAQEGGWSWGEIRKPETINYRTFKPENDGLFCAKIFGPIKDNECLCGKYKRTKHRRIQCEKCKVEVISSKVRRERLGHIELAAPVAHIWFLKSLPSRIGNLLDVTLKQVESVLYCLSFIITSTDEPALEEFHKILPLEELQKIFVNTDCDPSIPEVGRILTHDDYRNLNDQYGKIVEYYVEYLYNHIGIFKQGIELARHELQTFGHDNQAQSLRYSIEKQGQLYTSKIKVDSALRKQVAQWLDGLYVQHKEVKIPGVKVCVLTWEGDQAQGDEEIQVSFEPVAGDDLKAGTARNTRFVEELLCDFVKASTPTEPVYQLDGDSYKHVLFPLHVDQDEGHSEGIALYVQGIKEIKKSNIKEVATLFRTAIETLYGDLQTNLSTRVESALHTRTTTSVNPKVAEDLISTLTSQSEGTKTLREKIGNYAQKLIPQNRVSIVTSQVVTDEMGTRDLYYTVAGDEISSSSLEQDRIRSLVVESRAGTPLSQTKCSSLVIPLPEQQGLDGEYYLYLQALDLPVEDISNVSELFSFALAQLTRNAAVASHAGNIVLDSIKTLDQTNPPSFERRYHADGSSDVISKGKKFTASNQTILTSYNSTLKVENKDLGLDEEHSLEFGDVLRVDQKEWVEANQQLTEWPWAPFQSPILSEVEGIVVYVGLDDEDQTLSGQGKGARVCATKSKRKSKDTGVKSGRTPEVHIYDVRYEALSDESGAFKIVRGKKLLQSYQLFKGSTLCVDDGDLIGRAQPIAFVESSGHSQKLVEKKVADQIANKLGDQLSRFPNFRVENGYVTQTNVSFRNSFGFEVNESKIEIKKFLGQDGFTAYNEALSNSTGARQVCLIKDWQKGAQFLKSNQHVSLLGLLGAETTLFFVIESHELSTDLVESVGRLQKVISSMEAEFNDDDNYAVYQKDHNQYFNLLFAGFNEDLLTKIDSLIEKAQSGSMWVELFKTLQTAARFNQYLEKRQISSEDYSFFAAELGAEAVRKRLRTLDLFTLHKSLIQRIPNEVLNLVDTAFKSAYFFDYVDHEGFDLIEDLPAPLTRPEQGEVWSEENYLALCKFLKKQEVLTQNRPLFKVLPAYSQDDVYLLYNASEDLCKRFNLTLGQILDAETYAQVSQQAFMDGQTDNYVIKEIPIHLAREFEVSLHQEISYNVYQSIRDKAEQEGYRFSAQVAFEAQEISKGYAHFTETLYSLPTHCFERLSRSIRHSSDVSSDLELRKASDLLIDMVRWLDTLEKLKAFEVNPSDPNARLEEDLLDELRCSYFGKSDPRELSDSQCQSREWFLLSVISEYLRIEMIQASDSKKKKIVKRLKVIDAVRNSELEPDDWGTDPSGRRREWFGNKPEWMILEAIPVIPPDLRPLVPLEGGRFATSDLNDLYRRVINRNNRLRRLTEELIAPEIIQRNEKRMLQEAVDALFDNGRSGKPITNASKRPFKSLSAMIKGKQGRFRQNLLGKRVDYSGRSVIVVGPELRLHQCGLPKKMALELFKPFILNKLQEQGHAQTIKAAKKMVEQQDERVWDILDEVIQEHPVMLNRAPTLHRLGIQAFEPKLIEGKAIQLHPLVCTAFNADFDGDQMAVHLPLSIEAQIEARVLMMSTNNILSPANGKPIIVPSQDIVLGCYYMTRPRHFATGEGMQFASRQEARIAFEAGVVDLQAQVGCRIEGELVETTIGRLIMGEILPEPLSFSLVNKVMGKKELAGLIDAAYRQCTAKDTVLLADALKDLGYAQATLAGISIALVDLNISDRKKVLVEEGYAEVAKIQGQCRGGMISEKERYNKVIDKWNQVQEDVAKAMLEAISKEDFFGDDGQVKRAQSFNSVHIMADSGARGGPAQIRQLAGMRGLMAKPSGEIIETPITANFREGLSVLEYFISAHGARKGLADTALKTANSGYLTRRLVDVAQDAIITEYDCNQNSDESEGQLLGALEMRAIVDGSDVIEKLSDRVLGRVVLDEVYDEMTGDLLIESNTLIGEEEAKLIDQHSVNSVFIRSPLTCETRRGLCMLCYGRDLARGRLVNLGEAVGVIAAQSIGEPGTQLTMRTFHIGGAATSQARKDSITSRTSGTVHLENANVIVPTRAPVVKKVGGTMLVEWEDANTPRFVHEEQQLIINRNARLIIQDDSGQEKERHVLGEGYRLHLEDGSKVRSGQKVVQWDPFSNSIFSEVEGVAIFENISVDSGTLREEKETSGMVTRRISAPPRSSKARAGRAAKGRKTTKRVDVVVQSPRIRICKPHFRKNRDGQYEVTPGETIRFKTLDGTERDAIYEMPVNAKLEVIDGGLVGAGQPLAKTDLEATKTKDITGGLPRVAELFEARVKENSAVLSKIDGMVESITGENTKRVVTVVSRESGIEEREEHEIKSQLVTVREGDYVDAGDTLSNGPISPHEILKVNNKLKVADYLVNEIQQVYRLQGVRINDKHIEVIVRQMLRRVRIKEVGDTQFLPDEQVEQWILDEENERCIEEGKRPAVAEPLLLGITKASLATESFISASSFQETTKVLTAAALKGKIDYLHGLKENVIMGRLIPAGTGLRGYRNLTVEAKSAE
jgi:DNA-directed RNA polymerase subunit beta'